MSERPRPVTVPSLRARKRRNGDAPIVMVTAYDEPGARIVSDAGADIILVGRLGGQQRARLRRHAARRHRRHGAPHGGRGPGRAALPDPRATCRG